MAFKNFKGGARDYGRPREDRGGFGGDRKPSFGASRGGFGGGDRGGFGGADREMHTATCSNCNKDCQVPFRPSGTKPVYCKDCFSSMKGADERGPREDRGARPSRPFGGDRPQSSNAGGGDIAAKVEELNKKVTALAQSLDYAITLLKTGAPAKVSVEQKPVEKKVEVVVKASAPVIEAKPSKETRLAKKDAKPAAKKAVKGKKK